jgi:diphthamide synthase (EF-2-diphthine--ammonia ligase)
MRPKALIAWSSGKDSAWALHEMRRAGDYDIVGALTTVTETFGRVSMHGVRETLLRAQHVAAGLAPVIVPIPYPCPNDIYEARMAAALADAKARGVTHVIFGDLYLEDIRAYREQKLAGSGIAPVFPLWGRPTAALAREMIDAGVEAWLACVDLRQVPKSLAGRRLDHALLADLPAAADPCGEQGEFHTFVSAGPMLSGKIPMTIGDIVERDGFAFADFMMTQ